MNNETKVHWPGFFWIHFFDTHGRGLHRQRKSVFGDPSDGDVSGVDRKESGDSRWSHTGAHVQWNTQYYHSFLKKKTQSKQASDSVPCVLPVRRIFLHLRQNWGCWSYFERLSLSLSPSWSLSLYKIASETSGSGYQIWTLPLSFDRFLLFA